MKIVFANKGDSCMGRSLSDTVSFLGWGYYTAAIRGEVPLEVSSQNIVAWLETRPIYGQTSNGKNEKMISGWRERMAGMILDWLKKYAVDEEISEGVRC